MAHLITDSAGLAPLIFAGILGNRVPKRDFRLSGLYPCCT